MAQFTTTLLPAKEREKFPSEQREYERVNKCGHKIFPIVYKLVQNFRERYLQYFQILHSLL